MNEPKLPVKDEMTDEGKQMLENDAWALIWSPTSGFVLRSPGEGYIGENVPIEALALTTCMVRFNSEPDFLKEMAKWFTDQARQ